MVSIPVSVGELIDKLSILQVKREKITDLKKLSYVNEEFEKLHSKSIEFLNVKEIESLYYELVFTNSALWDIEDKLRLLETSSDFGDTFIELARKVYFTNDERFILKDKINQLTLSQLREVKDYVDYKKIR